MENKIKPTEDEIKSLERVQFVGFDEAYYARKDKIAELEKAIADDKTAINRIGTVLKDGDFCRAYKNDATIADYCSLYEKINKTTDYYKDFDSHGAIPFFMFGGFVILASGMMALTIFMRTKTREILAYHTQQVMPVGKEVVEEVTPVLAKVKTTILKETAPGYGEVAKEISKGIKEGMKDKKGEQ